MVRQPDLPIQAPDADRLGAASSTRESIEAPAVGAPTPQRRLTPAAVLELQRTAGNAAAQRYIARQPPPAAAPAGAPAADAGSPADTAVHEMILGDGGREKAFGACQAAHGQWDAAANGFEALKRPEPTLGYAAAAHLGEADGARAYAYLKYGTLRLADKLFIAGIGAGTDNETIWRLLPAVRTSYTQSEQDFVDAYTKQGRDAYGAYYTGVGELLDGSKSYLADFLDDEFDGADLAKAMALLTYGEVRPVDGIHIALSSVHMLSTSIMAAVEKAGREAPANSKGLLERQYLETYKQPLRDRLRGELGEASADFKRAQLVLDGDFTAKNRIKIACEGLGTDEDEVWKALQDAPDTELDGLREEWKRGGEIKTLITDELGGDDLKRFTAVMENRGNMAGRLAQFGVDVADVQGVIKAGLERVEVETAFREEWAQPTGDFRRQFTGEERIGAAMLWGDQLASSDPVKRVRLAAELASGAGVLRILVADIHTDAQRKLITDDGQLLGMLKGMDDWPRYESLLAPHEDLKARSDWMAEKFKREQGWWGDSASAQAFQDEKRDLDQKLAGAKDPHNLTPEERAQIEPQSAATEASLDAFVRTRDEFDALAIQVVGTAAGLLATMLTGGAAGPMTAALIARVALAQACASAAAVWLVKQERTTGAEAARAFAVGAASGATQALAAAPVARLLNSEAGAAITAKAPQIAEQAASGEFKGVGYEALRGTLESAAGGAAGSAVDSGSRAETWKGGFVDGLAKLFADVAQGAATSGVMGGAMDGIKAGLFGGGTASAAGGTHEAPPVPTKLEQVHVERARVMLEAEGMSHARWNEVIAGLGEYAPVAREAFAAARHEHIRQAVARMQAELSALGLQATLPEKAPFDVPVEVLITADAAPAGAAGRTPADVEKIHAALARLRQELGEGFGSRAGVEVREGALDAAGGVKGAGTYEMAATAMTPAELDARIQADIVKGSSPFMIPETKVKHVGLKGSETLLELRVPPGNTLVKVRVVGTETLPGAQHTTPAGTPDAGPGRVEVSLGPGGRWLAKVSVDPKLHPENVRYVVGHELDEIAGLVSASETARAAGGAQLTPEQLREQMRAGIFTADPEFGAQATVHDRAAASELFDMWKRRELARAQRATAEVDRLNGQIARHVENMTIGDPHNANQKNVLLQQAGDRSAEWRAFVDELNRYGAAGVAHVYMVGTGALAGGQYISAGTLAHVMFVGPRPAVGEFIAKGLSGGHDDGQFTDIVGRWQNEFAIVLAGERQVGGNTLRRYTQYMWADSTKPAPRRGQPGYPVDPNTVPPGWVRAGTAPVIYKVTVTDLAGFLREVEQALAIQYGGRNPPLQGRYVGTTASGVTFEVRFENGEARTVFPQW